MDCMKLLKQYGPYRLQTMHLYKMTFSMYTKHTEACIVKAAVLQCCRNRVKIFTDM
jgi:hypothetical protein